MTEARDKERMRGIFMAMAFAAASFASPAFARQEPMTCLGLAQIWGGTVEDIRHINEIPVPASFRQPFFAGGCARFSLVTESLVYWHLAFGNGRSTGAALAFLEADAIAEAPPLDAFAGRMAARWRSAQHDLRAAERLRNPPHVDLEAYQRVIQRSRAVTRLHELVGFDRNFLFLAQQYLNAAEFNGSSSLLEKSRRYFIAVQRARRLVQDSIAQGESETIVEQFGLQLRSDEMDDMEMRLAILQARLSRTPADIEAAARVLERHYTPLFRLAAERAYKGGEQFCDFGDSSDIGQLRTACEDDEYGFPQRVLNYWLNQARLDLLMAADPERYGPRRQIADASGSSFALRSDIDTRVDQVWIGPPSFDLAERLLLRDQREGYYGRVDDRLAELHMMRADHYVRLATVAGRDSQGAVGDEIGALNDLRAAARMILPVDSPGRFRQIAERYLAIARAMRASEVAVVDHGTVHSRVDLRETAYLAHVLEDLDAIATGDLPPP